MMTNAGPDPCLPSPEPKLKLQQPNLTVADAVFGKPSTPGETYLKMMRYNIHTIVAALK
jgi:ABC-type Zn uptake system ZnuABC Zn-binding protein ZnuA